MSSTTSAIMDLQGKQTTTSKDGEETVRKVAVLHPLEDLVCLPSSSRLCTAYEKVDRVVMRKALYDQE